MPNVTSQATPCLAPSNQARPRRSAFAVDIVNGYVLNLSIGITRNTVAILYIEQNPFNLMKLLVSAFLYTFLFQSR